MLPYEKYIDSDIKWLGDIPENWERNSQTPIQ